MENNSEQPDTDKQQRECQGALTEPLRTRLRFETQMTTSDSAENVVVFIQLQHSGTT